MHLSRRSLWNASLAAAIVAMASAADCAEESAVTQGPKFSAEQEEFFEKQVRPLLARHCYECHGLKTQENGLRLDSREHVLAGASGVKVVVPGKPHESRLIAVTRYDGDVQMPPDGKLPAADLEVLATWIKLGLPWSKASDPPAASVLASAASEADIMAERIAAAKARHWSLQPVRRPALPPVRAADWCATPLDYFILAKLQGQGLNPSPRADRRTLLRRASFDLVGLPPTADEVEAFELDKSPDAYANVVERLLASPMYGQRWGRHWLDIARYADTKGYAFQQEGRFPYAYTYRDYVIRAFNEDRPFDQFILEQLAADKLPLGEDTSTLAAMGFLTVGRQFTSVHDTIDDQIDVVSRGLLGLTVTCARCHDHKFDPIPQEDYYSLYGVFRSSVAPAEAPLLGEPQPSPEYAEYQREFAKRDGELHKFFDEEYQKLLDEIRSRAGDYLARIVLDKHDKSISQIEDFSFDRGDPRPQIVRRWREHLDRTAKRHDPVFAPWHRLEAIKDDDFAAEAAKLIANLEHGAADPKKPINRLVVAALAKQSSDSMLDVARAYGELLSQVYVAPALRDEDASSAERGIHSGADATAFEELRQLLCGEKSPTTLRPDEAKQVFDRATKEKLTKLQKQVDELKVTSPGAPPRAMSLVDDRSPFNPFLFIRGNADRRGKEVPRRFLAVLSSESREPFHEGSGRLELARAIASPDNPLTARVLVNRVWMQHFGAPLVITPSDLGVRCDLPNHAELLDYLSSELMAQGWSIKKLHRLIMLSSTYQQASAERPESIAKDPENRLLWRMNRRRLELEPLRDSLLFVAGRLDPALGGRPVQLWKKPYPMRRTVYGFVDRQDLPGVFHTFDFANPDTMSDERPQTTVPQQALFVMNSPLVLQQARHVAARPEVAGQDNSREKAAVLYRMVLARPAQEHEVDLALRFVESLKQGEPIEKPTDKAAEPALTPWEMLAHVLLLTNEFMFVD